MRFVLDTNIVIDHLARGGLEKHTSDYFIISAITEAEILRYSGLGKEELFQIKEFLSLCYIIPVDSIIARRAAEIGRTRKVKLPDLLIAATAIEVEAPLVTKNIKDFKDIPELELIQNLPS